MIAPNKALAPNCNTDFSVRDGQAIDWRGGGNPFGLFVEKHGCIQV